MEAVLAKANVWVDKAVYDEAERIYLERIAKGVPLMDPSKKSSLAGEVAKALERIKTSLESVDDLKVSTSGNPEIHHRIEAVEGTVKVLQKDMQQLRLSVESIEQIIKQLETKNPQVSKLLDHLSTKTEASKSSKNDDDDDVDLFGSESEEEDEETRKIKEQRVAEYAARKSNKPVLIAKSNIILDVKPWDDETDMKLMETEVRKITMDGLVWGASKLVPLAYGIKKLQISCVVEDDKVSVDDLQEKIQEIEDYVQSIDIAAFNKV